MSERKTVRKLRRRKKSINYNLDNNNDYNNNIKLIIPKPSAWRVNILQKMEEYPSKYYWDNGYRSEEDEVFLKTYLRGACSFERAIEGCFDFNRDITMLPTEENGDILDNQYSNNIPPSSPSFSFHNSNNNNEIVYKSSSSKKNNKRNSTSKKNKNNSNSSKKKYRRKKKIF